MGIAAAQASVTGACFTHDSAMQSGMHRLANLLTNVHTMPLPWEAPPGLELQPSSTLEGASPASSGFSSLGGAASAGPAAGSSGSEHSGNSRLAVPDSLDACRLLLTWVQASWLAGYWLV